MVERATSFSLIAYIVVDGRTYEGSASIVVLDKSEPPQEPPRISVEWPDGQQIVGSGTLLTILGTVSQGSNPLKELVVLDSDGSLLQKWPIAPGDFRVDLSNFGSPGRKSLRVRVIDSAGLYSETSIPVLNDDTELEAQARQFLKKYSCAPDGGSLRFAVTNIPVLVPESLKQYWKLFEEACEFWNKYCSVLYLYPTTSNSSEYVIRVFDETSQNSEYIAVTNRSYNGHEIVSSSIDLYKGWLDWPQDTQIGALTHELGHALVTASEIEEFGSRCVLWPILTDYRDQVIPTIMQRAIHLVYSYPPGWQP
jgi:hypothetical protein